MIKGIVVAVVFTCMMGLPAAAAHGEGLEGYWQGAVVREGSVQLIEMELIAMGDSLTGIYAIPELGLYEESVKEIAVTDSTVQVRILYGLFDLRRHGGLEQLTGGNDKWKPPVSLHLKKTMRIGGGAWVSERIGFPSAGITLAGTLVKPVGKGPFPAVVAVHGSGEQGRHIWEYRSHAYALARWGVAVLIYDKRGVGQSQGDLATATLDTLARDALAAVSALRARPDIKSGAVGLLGISQGGWIAAKASLGEAPPDFLIMLQGPAVSLEKQELDRVGYSMRADGLSEQAVDSALAHTRNYFRFVNSSDDWEALAGSSRAAALSTWAEYVNTATSPDDPDIAWWRQNAYDPGDDLRSIRVPVLAVFGELDTSVPPAENLSLLESHLKEAGIDFRMVVIPQLPHSVTTYQQLKGGNWEWPANFWVWSRRPVMLDSAMGAWVLERDSSP